MGKLKVLQINKLYYPTIGGVEQVVRQLSEGLKGRADIQVLACREKGATIYEKINDVNVCRAGSVGIFLSMPVSISFFLCFAKAKKDKDILHIHMPFPLADMAASFFRFKGKIVLWWHSDIIRQKKFMIIYKPFLIRLLNRADAIIVATQGHIDGSGYLRDYRHKCHIVPYGLSTEFLSRADEYIAKRPEHVDNITVRFLFVGRLVYYKGIDVLIKAFSLLKCRDNLELYIVGDGSLRNNLYELVIELGLCEKVIFTGRLDDNGIVECFEKADVFVLPSVIETEAFGLVQLEAMAFGLPVINTGLKSGVPYVSLNDISGITVPPNDVDALSKAMNKLIRDSNLRKRLGQGAYERVRSEFTEKKMVDGVYSLYEELCK